MKINLVQRSKEWEEWRKGKIGSSQAASVMGLNPYCSPYKQWEIMKGVDYFHPVTEAIQRGIDLEADALEEVCKVTKLPFQPCCYQKDDLSFLISSLDGVNEEQKVICEIKVSDRIYQKARQGVIDKMYQCQMQHQLMVTGFEMAIFAAYDGFNCEIIECKRNPDFIDEMVEREIKFYESLQNESADLTFLDKFSPVEINDSQKEIINNYLKISKQIKEMEEEEKRLKETIENFSDNENCIFIHSGDPLIKKNRISREGNVDWKGLCKSKGISEAEVSLFRKKSISYSTIKGL